MQSKKWVDLGLPSGRLWAKNNEKKYDQFTNAVQTYGTLLPSTEAWQEIVKCCSWKWQTEKRGYNITGPNGQTIFLPAEGWQGFNPESKTLDHGNQNHTGETGYYWSSTSEKEKLGRSFTFDETEISIEETYYTLLGFSIRLCKSK